MSFGKRQQPPAVAARLITTAQAPGWIVLASSLAVALMTAYFVDNYIDITMKPKVLQPLHGVHISRMPDVKREWAPAYLAPLVSGAFAFVLWRYFALSSAKPRILRGGFTMALTFPLAYIIAYEIPQISRFIQMWPLTEEFAHLWRALVGLLSVGMMKGIIFMFQWGLTAIFQAFLIGIVVAAATRAAGSVVTGGHQ